MAILLSSNGLNPGNASTGFEAARALSFTGVVSAVSKRKKKMRSNTTTTMTKREGSRNLRGNACLVGEYGFLAE
jgi:hypothetical protein